MAVTMMVLWRISATPRGSSGRSSKVEPSVGQTRQLLQLLEQREMTREQIQGLLDSGILPDVLEAAGKRQLDRHEIRKALGFAQEDLRVFATVRFPEVDWVVRLSSAGHLVNSDASYPLVLAEMRQGTAMDLVKVSVGDLLHFRGGTAPLHMIYKGASDWGLKRCPPVVAPLLLEQAQAEVDAAVIVGAEPIPLFDNGFLFVVGRTKDKSQTFIHVIPVTQELVFSSEREFIFMLP